MEYHGETELIIHKRTAKATDKLLALLAANHAPERPPYVAPPISNDVFEEAWSLMQPPSRGRVETIQRAVLSQFPDISLNDIKSARRTDNVVKPRQIAMYLAKELTQRSLPDIGRRFGGRDHTTVLHAVRKIRENIKTDAGLAAQIEAIKATITEMH